MSTEPLTGNEMSSFQVGWGGGDDGSFLVNKKSAQIDHKLTGETK